MEILVYGIINSVILSLMALGFTLVYSISRVPNFAYGALYITSGYIAWVLMNKLTGFPYPSLLAAPSASLRLLVP